MPSANPADAPGIRNSATHRCAGPCRRRPRTPRSARPVRHQWRARPLRRRAARRRRLRPQHVRLLPRRHDVGDREGRGRQRHRPRPAGRRARLPGRLRRRAPRRAARAGAGRDADPVGHGRGHLVPPPRRHPIPTTCGGACSSRSRRAPTTPRRASPSTGSGRTRPAATPSSTGRTTSSAWSWASTSRPQCCAGSPPAHRRCPPAGARARRATAPRRRCGRDDRGADIEIDENRPVVQLRKRLEAEFPG